EYMDLADTETILHEVARVGRPGARIVYWNLLVERHRPDSLADRIDRDESLARELGVQDRAFVYGAVQVEQVR
ncbi:MAG: DUF3419 domain-containing protein, partial [Myxococcota bacterium]|nr:DUF3419 domain-containing protein [Myxococcota bacterium]